MYVDRMTYGTRRSGGPPVVLSDGNTAAWFDSAENITKDGSDLVSAWGDKSGNGNHLLQGVPTNAPLYSAGTVLFDGDDMFMASTFTLAQPILIYMVMKQVTWTSGDVIFDGAVDMATILKQDDTTSKLIASAGTESDENTHLALNTWGIVRVQFDGAFGNLIVNEETAVVGNF